MTYDYIIQHHMTYDYIIRPRITSYDITLSSQDYIRAGMTCIKFFVGFSGRATTIIDLFSRLHYLERGRRHFHASLDAKRRPTVRRSGRSKGHRHIDDTQRVVGSRTKSMSTSELENHISTITLQMKVSYGYII